MSKIKALREVFFYFSHNYSENIHLMNSYILKKGPLFLGYILNFFINYNSESNHANTKLYYHMINYISIPYSKYIVISNTIV